MPNSPYMYVYTNDMQAIAFPPQWRKSLTFSGRGSQFHPHPHTLQSPWLGRPLACQWEHHELDPITDVHVGKVKYMYVQLYMYVCVYNHTRAVILALESTLIIGC